jgi:hypothetical protein
MAKKVSDALVEKAIEAVTMAIEIYNKPLAKYRTETCAVLMIAAWEQIFKAAILKNRWARLYDSKTGWYKPFDECLECVKSNSKLPEDAYQSIKLLYEKRCRIIHYQKGMETLDYMALQSNIIFFRDFVSITFNKSIIKDRTWYMLPIGTEVPFTKFDFVSYASSMKKAPADVRDYFKEVIRIQNDLSKGNSSGILIGINVNLTNIKRIKKADITIGIDGSKEGVGIDGLMKISQQGKPVSLTLDEFRKLHSNYPLTYAQVYERCRKKGVMDRNKFQSHIDRCKKDQNLAINWKTICGSLNVPFKISDKYMYKERVVDDFSPPR